VVTLWSNIQRAAHEAVLQKGKKLKINHCWWWVSCLPGTKLEFLWCQLPSGRKLAYFGPEIKYEQTFGDDKRPVLYHWGVNPLTKKWELGGTYGGKLCENVVQAIARDLMVDSMLRIEDRGFDVILTVHDEIVAERNSHESDALEFEKLMAECPPWANGLPVRVEAWSGNRYRK
jgi:DNA polymerase